MLYLGNKSVVIGCDEGHINTDYMIKFEDSYSIYFVVNNIPYKLDYKVKDPNKCFIRKDTYHDSNYIILDGMLFQIVDATLGMDGLVQVGTSDKWTEVTGRGLTDGSSVAYGFGICNGKLYRLYENKATSVSVTNIKTDWKNLTGFTYISSYSTTATSYADTILTTDSKIYRCHIYSGNSYAATMYANDNGQEYTIKLLSGSIHNNTRANNGSVRYPLMYDGTAVYYLKNSGTFVYKLGDISNVKKLSGLVTEDSYTSSNNYFNYSGYALTDDGRLMQLTQKYKMVEVDTLNSGWTDVAGYSACNPNKVYSVWAMGINNDALYYFEGSKPTKVEHEGNWTMISGYTSSSRSTFGICNNRLYSIKNKTTITDIGLNKVVKVTANGTNNVLYPTFVMCKD